MTKFCDIWMAHADHQRLMAHLFPGDGDEHAAILRCGIVGKSDRLRLLVREVVLASDGKDHVIGDNGYLTLTPAFVHSNIIACRNERLAYLTVHNHDCDDSVQFSAVDMRSHELGYGALRDIGKGVPVGALVFDRRSVEADVWLPDGGRAVMGEFRVIGSTVRRFYANPRRATVAKAPLALDRQVRMFGPVGQAILKKSTVAIIGLGGVGSLVSEYLSRLGVGRLIFIDPDAIEDTNLARVVGATLKDVKAKRLKVEIAERVAREAQPDISVRSYAADVADCRTAEQLKYCDFIFLAADSMRARLVVNAVAHQYFVPVVQLGAKIRSGANGQLAEAMSAVRQIRPGHGCLWCNEFIDPGQLAIEGKSDEERKAQAYGTNEPNPSVITMNGIAAAAGVNDFLFDFLGLRDEGDAYFEHHFFLQRRVQRVVPKPSDGCRECQRRYAMGDALNLPCVNTDVVATRREGTGVLTTLMRLLFRR